MNTHEASREMFLIASEALAHYDVGRCRPVFLGHGQNVTFRVDAQGGRRRFLLRMHRPARRDRPDVRRRSSAITSELAWLDAIDADTDIVVQRPLRNRFGDTVTEVATLHGPIHFTLLCWVDGKTVKPGEYDGRQARSIGKLTALLHEHADAWQLPEGFDRPRYDGEKLLRALDALGPAARDEIIAPSDLAMLEDVGDRVARTMDDLGESADVWGLIHADLYPDNIVFCDGAACPLDFDRCGFGHRLFDMGWTIFWIPREHRSAFLDGYREIRSFDAGAEELEAFYLAAQIDSIPYWAARDRRWVGEEHVPRLVAEECAAFLDGRRFVLPE